MAECQQEFKDFKAYLSSPPLLSPSKPGEEFFLYLVVSLATVSAALNREEDKVQKPIYYASRALRGAKERYPPMEKLTFALVTAARKLKPTSKPTRWSSWLTSPYDKQWAILKLPNKWHYR